MKAVLLIALFGAAVINAAISELFFGCSMKPVQDTFSKGTGAIVCYSGQDDLVDTMACSWSFANVNQSVSAAHFHVGTPSTASGPPTFTFSLSGGTSGNGYQKFTATSGWTQQGTTTFADQVSQCANAGCYWNLHTGAVPSGELRCELGLLSPTYDFTVQLNPTPGSINSTNSIGAAHVAMAAIGDSGLHAWGYQVGFLTYAPISAAHIHQGTSLTDNAGPPKVFLDQGPGRTAGKFVGVALEGVTSTPSHWATYAADFDTAIANHFCYINIHTTANGAGEIRANISPSGASQITLGALAVLFMIASWMSL